MKRILFWSFLLLSFETYAQNLAPLTVEKIMRDPKWIGTSPTVIHWSEDSQTIYFQWNPEKNKADSLYAADVQTRQPTKVPPTTRLALPAFTGVYNRARTQKVYEKSGDIYWMDIPSGKVRPVTNTAGEEKSPSFSHREDKILYVREDNLFSWDVHTGETVQWTDFRKGKKKAEEKPTEQNQWLSNDQLKWMGVVKERSDKKKATEKQTKAEKPKRPKEIYLDEQTVETIVLSPDEQYVLYRLLKKGKENKVAVVPNYVTESGYTEELTARTKVGEKGTEEALWVYDRRQDTVFVFSTAELPGITDQPDYRKDYPQKAAASKKDSVTQKPATRSVHFGVPQWSEDGKQLALILRADDNKDRWLALADLAKHQFKTLDRRRDEAWVAGPGALAFGWLSNEQLWFESEATGYAHLYSVNSSSGEKKQWTKGSFEVSEVQLSKDKKQIYFLSNEVHPGEKHLYRLSLADGKVTRLTKESGAYEYQLSPDEKRIALRYSTPTQPWDLYVMETKSNTPLKRITESTTAEFRSYAWRTPEVIAFPARDGATVYARLFEPQTEHKNGAAVIFVHGAGYLQNAHKWWSQYFREYMFHNLLADKGYTVLDIDYRGSAGYGRDWRTGIYRYMGGKDLTDHLDGAKLLVEKYGIDAKRIGIYGGSYGGFITLMAMFTQPDVFAAGAALRSVTDWAHYNQEYTANILNEPTEDSLAYARSSPIYYAEGLKGHLLMCHGMVDVNVHFQDIVRLSQRLIELKKDNWELAVYPMEDHAFVEASSWTDEYKRILKLFEERLKPTGKQ